MKKRRQCMLMHESCVVECVLVCMVRFWCKITASMCLNYVSKYVKCVGVIEIVRKTHVLSELK